MFQISLCLQLASNLINKFQNTSKITCWEMFKWLTEYFIPLFPLCADCRYEHHFEAYFVSIHLSPVVFCVQWNVFLTNTWLASYINIKKFSVKFTVELTVVWILTHHSIQNTSCWLPYTIFSTPVYYEIKLTAVWYLICESPDKSTTFMTGMN